MADGRGTTHEEVPATETPQPHAPNPQELLNLLAGLPTSVPLVPIRRASDGLAVHGFAVADGEQRAVWQKLQVIYPQTGLWPFITELSPAEWLTHERICRTVPWPSDPVDHRRILTELITAQRHRWADDSESQPGARHLMYDTEALATRLTRAPLTPVPDRDLVTEHLGPVEVWICLVAAAPGGYDIPARLRAPHTPNWLGGPNHRNLRPIDHSAVLRSWHEHYDATLCYLDTCAIELSVGRPPQQLHEVAQVAVEQYAYCDDFDQILGDVEQVARQQVPAHRWYFWWD